MKTGMIEILKTLTRKKAGLRICEIMKRDPFIIF